MRRLDAPWLVLAATIAVAAATVDTISWLSWRTIAASLEVNPEGAAEKLAASPLMALPASAVRSRRLAVSQLQGAATESIVDVLTRVGALQRRWMPLEAVGFVNLAREEFLRGRPQACRGDHRKHRSRQAPRHRPLQLPAPADDARP